MTTSLATLLILAAIAPAATGSADDGARAITANGWSGFCAQSFVPPPRTTLVWTGTEILAWGGAGAYDRDGYRYQPGLDAWLPMAVAGSPNGRYGHTAVWTGSRMILWGGGTGNYYFTDFAIYDPATDGWTPRDTPSPIEGRTGHSAVWTGTEMVIWGGSDTNNLVAGGARYDPAANAWTVVATSGAPSDRKWHSAVWTGSRMVVWGGSGQYGVASGGGRYDPASDSWQPMSLAGAPPERYAHGTVWTGQEMVVWGGWRVSELQDGGRYDPVQDSWSPMSATGAPSARAWHSMVLAGGELIVWGGSVQNGQIFQDGGRYELASDSWSATSDPGPATGPREGHQAFWTGSEMLVFGGHGPLGWLIDAVGYTPATGAWRILVDGSRTRGGAALVWTGGEVAVWGGTDGGSVLTDGERYDPALEVWSPISPSGEPPGRISPSAVWTGSEMVVWGGMDENEQPIGTGGRYDAANDTWRPMAYATPRAGHTTVWTGSEMIVFGGSYAYDSGGRYDPVLDVWTPVQTAGAPFKPFGHAAVWTGSEMIVWGGGDFYGDDTGARYDPVADAWTPTAVAGAPSPRNEHSAVWTGSRMIVWGGGHGGPNTYFADGGIYDPATDSWSSLPASVLSPRIFHAAAWTGTEMLLWGGWNGGYTLGDGARFDPSTGSWTLMASAGAPSPRSVDATAWTGQRMVLWGGERPQIGGAYAPASDSWCDDCAVGLSPGVLPDGVAGVPYSATLQASGGAPPYTYAIAVGSLPAGLSLDASSGTISGTPTEPGSTSFTAEATDSLGCRAARSYVLAISCAGPVAIDPPALPGGEVGAPYTATIHASGGVPPYVYAVVSGALPPGLSLQPASGIISGTPSQPGSATFTIEAVDAYGCRAARLYDLVVACSGDIVLDPPALPAGAVGRAYGATVHASGGSPPYAYSLAAGALPAGLGLDIDSGAISGVPVAPGTSTFDVQATDAGGCYGRRGYTVAVTANGPSEDLIAGQGFGEPNPNRVRVVDASGQPILADFHAYAAGTWGVGVASGEIAASLFAQILTGPGPGPQHGPQVRGFDRSGTPLGKVSYFAYGTLRYGVDVTSADLDADAFDEVVTGAGPGAVFGPHVRGWDVDGGAPVPVPAVGFFAYGTLKYGVDAGRTDLEGDGVSELLTGPGPGPTFAPTVRAFAYDGTEVSKVPGASFDAYATGFGTHVAGGDATRDGDEEIVTAPGAGAACAAWFKGFDLEAGVVAALPGFDVIPFAGAYGGRPGTGELDGTAGDELLCGAGPDPAAGATVHGFSYDGALLPLPATFVPFSSVHGCDPAGGKLGP